MLRKFYFLLGFCCLGRATAVRAQTDFRPGYIVTLTGDTVRGQADYRGSRRSAELCRFRPAIGAAVATYGPAQLRGYGFQEGRQYCSRLVPAIDSVQYQATPAPKPVFLEILVAGPLTLCQTRTSAGADRYFVFPAALPISGPLAELVAQRPDESRFVTRAYRRIVPYRGVLSELMADCPSVRMAVASLPFAASTLIAIVQRYNACRQPGTAPAATLPATARQRLERPRFGVLVGAETSRLSFSGATPLANGRFVSAVLPVVGLSFEVPLVSLNEKLSLRIEALVERQRYSHAFAGRVDYTSAGYQLVQFNPTYLRVPLLVRYTYPAGKLRPFAQAGLTYAQSLQSDNTIQLGYANSVGNVDYGPEQPLAKLIPGVVDYEFGLAASLGVHLPLVAGRALTVELRTERSTGLLALSGVNGSNQRFFGLLGYSLTK